MGSGIQTDDSSVWKLKTRRGGCVLIKSYSHNLLNLFQYCTELLVLWTMQCGLLEVNKYRVEVTKNGITKTFVQKSDKDIDDFWNGLWESFNCEAFSRNLLMVRQPDFVRLVECSNETEDGENKETT